MYNFRTRDRKYWGESVLEAHDKGPKIYIYTREFSLILENGSLKYILSLLCNVATLALNVKTLQRRDVTTSRRQFYPPLERRDVDIQCRDVGKLSSLERHDVGLNVATLENVLSGTSRRCPKRHDVAPNVATLPCLWPKSPSFFVFTLLHYCLTLVLPVSAFHTDPCWNPLPHQSEALRHLLIAPSPPPFHSSQS